MTAKNCPRCGRLFQELRSPICPRCEKEEEEIFQNLKRYIIENPMCTMQETAEACDVSVRKIMKYVREGRLEISKGMQGDVRCDGCGRPLTKGRMCDKCQLKFQDDVKDMFGKNGSDESTKKNRSSSKMYTSKKI